MEKIKEFLKDTLKQEIYTKKEVAALLIGYGKRREDQSREKTLNEIQSYLSEIKEKIGSDFYFRIDPDIIDPDKKNTFRGKLYEKLNNNQFFEGEVKKSDFERIFSGVETKGKRITKIKWKNDRDAIYLIYCLYENDIIDNENYSTKAEKFFGIDKNSATTHWSAVKDNPNVPKRRISIETYVTDALSEVAPDKVT